MEHCIGKQSDSIPPNNAGNTCLDILSAARTLAMLGLAVVPIVPRGKRPLTKRGVHDATTDVLAIEQLFDRQPDANIGIATGALNGLVVLDIDPDHGGEQSLRALLEQYGPLSPTLCVATGGGGRHLYFRHPGGTVRNSAGRLGAGLDIRGDGGYVVAPPSIHESGHRYRWISGVDV